jgi:transposase
MTRPLSIELREKVVNAYKKSLGSANVIAEMFDITSRSVFRYLKLERETGDLLPEPIPDRPPILTDIGAIGITSVVAAMYVQTAVNAEIFEVFLKQLLNPKLSPGKYVIMDNVAFHKSNGIVKLIESTRAKVVFLPPCSPDLSPIEKMWSKVEIVKRLKPRSNAEFHQSLASALHAIDEEDLQGWYEECAYNVAA